MGAPDSIDARAISLDQLLDRIQTDRATVRIFRDGRPVAEVTPVEPSGATWQLRPIVDALKPTISREDAMSPLDEDDWPAEARS